MTDVTHPTPTARSAGLARVARPSGAFAMLAVDQREAMRAMFAEHQAAPVTDQQLTDFKVAATRVLTPYASARPRRQAVRLRRGGRRRTPSPRRCGLIAAADRFIEGNGEFVTAVEIDHDVDPAAVRDQGAVAMKLLVIHRPDEPAATRDRDGRGVRRPVPRRRPGEHHRAGRQGARARAAPGTGTTASSRRPRSSAPSAPTSTRPRSRSRARARPTRSGAAARRSPTRCRRRGSSCRPASPPTSSRRPWSSPAVKARPASSPAAPSGRRSSAATTSSAT